MSDDTLRRRLYAYHDGELGWWARNRIEARLRRSSELRRELAVIAAIGRAARDSESDAARPELWGEIAGRLRVLDAGVEEPGTPARRSLVSVLAARRPLGAAALAAAAVAGILLLRTGSAPPAPEAAAAVSGVVRYLDTGGEPVMLVEDWDDVTIIWLMDSPADAV
jgi:anti-sigma factor RsiW